jgi:SM-20-related protein
MNEIDTNLIPQIIEDLSQQSYAIAKGFVKENCILKLRTELDELSELGQLQKAGIGQGSDFQIQNQIRGDQIYWLDTQNLTPAQTQVFAQLTDLKTELNRNFYLGINNLEFHLALYPSGGHYDKHLDSFRNSDSRKVSFILYLNANWQPEFGGQLRIYLSDEKFVDIEPESGTLACFFSQEVWHEVRPTSQTRRSLTGWFRRDDLGGLWV